MVKQLVKQFRPNRVSQRLTLLRLVLGSGTIAVLFAGSASLSQQSTDLPPPPALSSSAPSRENPVLPNPALPQSEQVFQAPDFPVPQTPIPVQSLPTRRYTVFVNGNSSYLLELVQAVEPKAELRQRSGEQMIQAGVFETESEAQQRVARLKDQGIRSEVASETSQSGAAQSGSSETHRYFVIIPGSPAELPQLAQQAMRLGVRSEAIQPRDRPLGTHLEIGAFSDQSQAEAVSRSLRNGGMDARVHFNR